jgi:hypothetical protein
MRKLRHSRRQAEQLRQLLEAGVRVYTPEGEGIQARESPVATRQRPVPIDRPPRAQLAEQDPTAALDDYEIRHLGEHLESMGDGRTLDKILRLEWSEPTLAQGQRISVGPSASGLLARLLRRRPTVPDGSASTGRVRPHPAWFEAKNRINRPEGFVEDIQRAWRLAARTDAADLANPASAAGLGLLGRYALVLASVNSYASAVPAPLVVALVRGEIWTAPQAIAYARRVPDPEERLTLMTALLPALPEPLRSEAAVDAFDAARQLRAEGGSRKVISSSEPQLSVPDDLAARLPAAQVRQALDEVHEKRGPLLRRLAELGDLNEAVMLAAGSQEDRSSLVPFMSEDEVRRHLADPDGPGSVYSFDLYLRLAALGHVDEAMQYARTLEFPGPRKDIFFGIVPHLRPSEVDQAQAAAAELLQPDGLVLFLAAVAQAGGEPDRARLLDEALVLVPTINEYSALDLLTQLIPLLDERQLDVAAALVRRTRGTSYTRLMALFALARASTGERRDWALRSALKSSPRDARALLGRLLPAGWPAIDPSGALQASIDAGCAVQAMEYLAPHLPKSLLARTLQALTRVSTPEWEWRRFDQRVAVALAVVQPADGLRGLARLPDPVERALGIMDLAETLPASQLEAALDIACDIPVGDDRIPALEALAPYLPESLLGRALDACHGEFERLWARALESFAPYLTPGLLRAAVADADQLKDDVWQAWAYYGVAAYLPLPDLWDVERLVRALPQGAASYTANHALAKLAQGFAAQGEHQHAVDLLRDVGRVGVSAAVDMVIAMADSLPADMLDTALGALGDQRTSPSLAPAARRLPAPQRQEWLEAVMRHVADQGSAVELAVLSVSFGKPDADAVLDEAEKRGEVGVIPVLAPILPANLADRAVALARSTADRDATARTRAFLALADRLHQEGAESAGSLVDEALSCALDIEPYRHLGTDIGDRSELWRKLRSRLNSLPVARQNSLVVRALTELAPRDRSGCLSGLGELVPLIGKLSGRAVLAEVEAAASDVARWWP